MAEEDSERHAAVFKAELIAALSEIEQEVKIDWTQPDASVLLRCFAISACWSWDAMIRICGVPPDETQVSKDPGSWDGAIRKMNPWLWGRGGMNFDDLATLGINGSDLSSIILFAFIVMQCQRAQREIIRRLQDLPVGKQIVYQIDRFPNRRNVDFLSVIQPPPSITRKGKKRYLSDPAPNAFDSKEKEETRQSLNIEATQALYNRLSAAVKSKSVPVPFSPLVTTHPAPAAWEQAFPRIVQQEIKAQLTNLLPVLNGSMEKAPFKSFDLYRDVARSEQKWSILKGADQEANDIPLIIGSGSGLDILIDVIDFKSKLDALEKRSPTTTRRKVRPMIEMYIKTRSVKETVQKHRSDPKTLRKWLFELGLVPVKPVSTRRKGK